VFFSNEFIGRVLWDLTYEPLIDPWFARDREKVGLFEGEEMSSLVYMPGDYFPVRSTNEADAALRSAPGSMLLRSKLLRLSSPLLRSRPERLSGTWNVY